MFGNAPRALWQRWISPDEQHRIELACRAFLIEDHLRGRRILLETGIGLFFEPKLRARFGISEPTHRLLENLTELGSSHEEIDLLILSHLHFDHAGGLLEPWREGAALQLLFPKARFLLSARQWERAQSPHSRDRASYIPELLDRLEESGRLELIEDSESVLLGPDFRFHFSDGHSPGLMMTELKAPEGGLLFCSDLIPGRPWMNSAITMGYDRFPELLIDEKVELLGYCERRGIKLLFTHDPGCAMAGIARDQRGRFQPEGAQSKLREHQL